MSTQTAPPRDPRTAEGPAAPAAPPAPQRRPAGRVRRTAAALLGTLILAVPTGAAVWFSWNGSAVDADVARNEQAGVTYLQPLNQLISTLVDGQSGAVRGARPSAAALNNLVTKVNDADAQFGATDSHRRWTVLRDRIGQLQRDTSSGKTAYERHGEVIDLALDLAAKVGDESELILDPELDSYYLMDTALLRLPVVMVQAARYADLVALGQAQQESGAAQQKPGQTTTPALTQAQIEAIVAAATARDLATASAVTVDTNLRKSVDATATVAVRTSVTAPLSAFKAAVDQISRRAVVSPEGSASAVNAAAAALRVASLQLSTAVLDSLDGLLTNRERGFVTQQVTIGVICGLGVLAAFAVLWLLLPSKSVTEPAEQAEDATEPREIRRTAAGVAQPAAADAMEEIRALLGARELLRAGELVRVGRAVRPGRREPGGDSQ